MFSARRVYVYLVSLISLGAVTLAAISLLQDVLAPGPYSGDLDIALQIAILVIATPIYLGHWTWQEHKIASAPNERGAIERRIYLYVVMGAAVSVAAYNVFNLLRWILDLNVLNGRLAAMPYWQVVAYFAIPLVIAAATWFYHFQLLRNDQIGFPDTGEKGSVHRIYLYIFAAAGLALVVLGSIEIIRWLLSALGDVVFHAARLDAFLKVEIPQIVVGLTIWLVYWMSAQQLFRTGNAEETGSILRKFYLYAAIFIGVAGSVSAAALILSGVFETWLGLTPDGDIRNPVSVIIVMAMLWIYHRQVLSEDANAAENTAQQDGIQRIYLYLLAAVGLVAVMVGIIGNISTLLFIVDEGISDAHRQSLSYFSSALIAGLPVWYLAWQKAQQGVAQKDKAGIQARESLVRKIYLYFFLFVSITSALGSAIYVLYRILQWFLSSKSLTLVDVAIPLTIAVVEILVWTYHLTVLRSDRRLSLQDEVRRLTDVRLALVDDQNSPLLRAIADRLHRAAPDLDIPIVDALNYAGAGEDDKIAISAQIQQAEVVVIPSSLLILSDNGTAQSLTTAVAHSHAQKIVVPGMDSAWHWVGLEKQGVDKTADAAVEILLAVIAGDEITGRRGLGCGAIALAAGGGIVLLAVLIVLIRVLTAAF